MAWSQAARDAAAEARRRRSGEKKTVPNFPTAREQANAKRRIARRALKQTHHPELFKKDYLAWVKLDTARARKMGTIKQATPAERAAYEKRYAKKK